MATYTRHVTGGYLVLTVPEIVIALVLAWLFMRPSPPPVADAREVPGDNAGDAAAGNVFRQYKKSA